MFPYLIFGLYLLECIDASLYGSFSIAGEVCQSTAECNSNATTGWLLICTNGICLCNQMRAHYVIEYLDIKNQERVSCQSLAAERSCHNLYSRNRRCSCPPGKIALLRHGEEHGFCTSDAEAWQEYGSFCSSVKSACNVSQLLTCQEHKCQCPLNTHHFNDSLPGCVPSRGYTPLYNHHCSVEMPCHHRFYCVKGQCQCPEQCGPYLESELICACEMNRGWRLLLYKILPLAGVALLLFLLFGSIWYFVARSRSRSRCSREAGGGELLGDTSALQQHSFSAPAESSMYSASAPPIPLDGEPPPSYEDVMRESGR